MNELKKYYRLNNCISVFHKIIRLILISTISIYCSCSRDNKYVVNGDLSLFAFVISDNNLDDHTEYVENDLVKGLRNCPIGTEMFLYIDRLNESPILRQLFLLESGQVGVKTIANYTEQCSTSKDVFRDVLSTMLKHSSGSEYGLIYWSHGNGWLPALKPEPNLSNFTKAIGADGIYSMDITDMADILTATKKPLFIVFDACFMGGIETAYALRNSTDYLISSPAEMLGVGFPYHLMLPDLVKGTRESLSISLNTYLDFCYSDYYGDGTCSGIASLIDCREIDSLAKTVLNIVNNSCDNIIFDSLQTYDSGEPHLYYDFGQYVKTLTTDTAYYALFTDQLERSVIKKVSTHSIFTQSSGKDSMLTITSFSGLNTFIPGSAGYYFDQLYSRNEWYKYCYETNQ